MDAVLGEEFGEGDAAHGGEADDGDHGVTVAAEDEGGDVFHGDAEFHGYEGAIAGGVEDAGHADDAVAGELRYPGRPSTWRRGDW